MQCYVTSLFSLRLAKKTSQSGVLGDVFEVLPIEIGLQIIYARHDKNNVRRKNLKRWFFSDHIEIR